MESFAGNILTDKNAISVYCGSGTTATVKLEENTLTLDKNGSPTALDLTQEANDTLSELVTVINALGADWSATLLGKGSAASKDNMADFPETSCLLETNAQTLKTLMDDVINFPAGYDADDKREAVQLEEERIEKITHDFFYSKAFDIKINGNGKDQIFIPFMANVLTVTALYVWGISIDSAIWTYSERSVLLDLESSGGGWAEFRHLLKEWGSSVLFPRGLKNVRIVGTCGWSSCPMDIRKAAAMMVMDGFDETLYDHWRAGSLSLGGDVSYSNPKRVHTGILPVDRILDRYVRRRPMMSTTGSFR
jgi:hypothetical protein